MGAKLSEVLEECLARIKRGETIGACLADYSHLQQQLEPLLYMLHTAQSIYAIPKVAPSDDFKRISRARLTARILKL